MQIKGIDKLSQANNIILGYIMYRLSIAQMLYCRATILFGKAYIRKKDRCPASYYFHKYARPLHREENEDIF
jgi:hypothetical protein